MKPVYTTICAIAFLIAGIVVTFKDPEFNYRSKAQASTVSYIDYSTLPLDIRLGLANRSNNGYLREVVHDTIPLEIRHDTVPVPVVKYKYRTRVQKVVEKDTLHHKTDTLYVPVVNIQVPLVKEEAKDSHKHYIHVVDTVCNGISNSIR